MPEDPAVTSYLANLPDDRRALMTAALDVVRRQMPPGYAEAFAAGMITWTVPLQRYPSTYNKQPLLYAGLAAHKSYCTIYLMSLYSGSDDEQAFRARWAVGGRKLDMGKSCLHFRSFDELDVDLIEETIASTSVEDYIARCELIRTTKRAGPAKT